MANCVIGWPIFSDPNDYYSPLLTGGSWRSALPLSNLQNYDLGLIARSTTAALISTTFDINLQVQRPVRVLALMLPNATSACQVIISASNTAGNFNSPLVWMQKAAYPVGFTAETFGELVPTAIFVLPGTITARYWRVEIQDAANPDGYVDVSRLVVAGGWQPTVNMINGGAIGLETDSESRRTDGGSAVHKPRPVRRTSAFSFENLTDNEAVTQAFRLQRLAGTTEQMFWVFDPDDPPELMIERSFLSVLRQLSAVEFAFVDRNRIAFQMVEEL